MAEIDIAETSFEAWDDCLRLSNGEIELVVTTGIGPRVLAVRFPGGENLCYTDQDKEVLEGDYRVHGGHRLWHAPEDRDRTYVRDEDPLEYETTDRGITLVQPTEGPTGIQKTMSLELAEGEPAVELTHELTNEGVWDVEFAPWAITVCGPGGEAVVPLSGGDPDALVPDRSLTLWPYDSMADERVTFADEEVRVAHDDDGDGRFKIGASGADEWAAYVRDGTALCKEFSYDPEATYPDKGSAVEVYTDESVLELETLGPMREVAPGESAVHTETWRLLDGVEAATVEAVRAQL